MGDGLSIISKSESESASAGELEFSNVADEIVEGARRRFRDELRSLSISVLKRPMYGNLLVKDESRL